MTGVGQWMMEVSESCPRFTHGYRGPFGLNGTPAMVAPTFGFSIDASLLRLPRPLG